MLTNCSLRNNVVSDITIYDIICLSILDFMEISLFCEEIPVFIFI